MAFIEIAPPVARSLVSEPARAKTKEKPAKAERASTSVVANVVLTLVSIASVIPLLWMYSISLRPTSEAFSLNPFVTITGDNYLKVAQQLNIPLLVGNTFGMAIGVTLGQLVTSVFAAYAFSRWRFPGHNVLFFLVMASWLVPFQVTMLPNYVLLWHLGMLNSLTGVILPQLASAYGIILLRQHFASFPTELYDAAEIDGRNSWTTLWRVVLPNLISAISALGILLFISSWNEYFWPMLVFRDASQSVLQLAIQPFLGLEGLDYGALMAISGLACIPIFIIYLIFQRRVVNAFVRSGLK